MKSSILLSVLFLVCTNIFSQDLIWNGNANNDFFDEGNWQDKTTGLAIDPSNNILRWNQNIDRNLEISNASLVTSWNDGGILKMGSGILTVTHSTIKMKALAAGTIHLEEGSYLEVLDDISPIENGLVIDLKSGISWVKIENLKPEEVATNHLSKIKVNTAVSVYKTNLRLDNYYAKGTIVRSNLPTIAPATFYDQPNLSGVSVSLTVDAVHSGSSITNLNNKIASFVLKKGFMLTVADDEVGTGKSKNYIASETDLIVNKLPTHLLNRISFVRVVPWNWVTKKGIAISQNASLNEVGGTATTLGNTWLYRWSNSDESTLNGEYTPMSWGANGADEDADISLYRQQYKTTHVLSFNESDHCTGQSGQYRNLCQEDVAVGYHRNLMKTGLRIVSPAGRENAPFGWLKNFYDKATAQDIRIDVIAVHWYDWGSNPEVNQNPTSTQVFNRFKDYLERVHNEYGLPIWITEFNANRYRNNAIQLGFMQLALPYLESLDYVERYAWFEPVHPTDNANQEGSGDYYDDTNFTLTNLGTYFKNHDATPSVPEPTFLESDNIGKNYESNLALNHNIVTNGDFKTGDSRAWLGYNNQVVIDTDDTTTNLDIFKNESVGNINNGAGSLYQVIEVSPNVSYTVSFDYKWKGDGGHNLTAEIRSNLSGATTINSKVLNTNFDVWYSESINFTVPANVYKARLFFNKTSGNRPLRITNVKVRLNPNKTWNGSISNDWNTAGNWVENTVPISTDVVFIPRGLTNYPTVSDHLTLAQLVIDSGASFITSGTVSNSVTYYADLNDTNWHLLSSPVETQVMNQNWVAAAGIATGNNNHIAIGTYQNETSDVTTGPWVYFKSTDAASQFLNGTGFAMKKLSRGMFLFNGSLPSSPKTIPISQGAASHWNLIGNSFPSYVDVDAFLTANTTPLKDAFEAVYIWNADTESYNALTSGYIHPGQAFFVNSNVASTNVHISESMLSHQENGRFYKTTPKPSIVLHISDGIKNKTTEINYLEGKTTGLDPRFDVGLFDGVSSDFKIYTHLVSENDGIPFMKQALPNKNFETMVVPIGIQSAAKEITFFAEAVNFPEGIHVFIEDRLSKTLTQLDEPNTNYKVVLTETTDATGRFFLHTRTSATLHTEDVTLQNISIYNTTNETLRIVGLSEGNANIKLFSILGKQVFTTDFKSTKVNELALPKLATGVYFVKLTHNKRSFTKKIILE